MRFFCQKFGEPEQCAPCFHVAGSKGKGSVSTFIASILDEAGYTTGIYTSPHILDFIERISSATGAFKAEVYNNAVEELMKGVQSITQSELPAERPITWFELVTLFSFLVFRQAKVDYSVFEVGLGGRLDSTNVVHPLCSIITPIELEHTEFLGDTVEKIAYEKAGIIKQNCPVITSMGFEAIKDKADKMNSMLIFVSPYVSPEFTEALTLKGLHQQENLALVITAINYLFPEMSKKAIISGLKRVKHHCRFEFISGKNIIIDGAHNPNGIQALRSNLDLYYPKEQRRFIFGCLKNKDYKKMINILFREGDEIYFNEFDYPNACSYEELSKACKYRSNRYYGEEIITPERLNIICGSFYMISQLPALSKYVK